MKYYLLLYGIGRDLHNVKSTIDFFRSLEPNINVIYHYLKVDNIVSLIEIIYEDSPIKIRKVRVKNKNTSYEFGFFNIKKTDNFDKKFFSLIDPYLLN